ncbi:MAG: GNVR domain-containing protein [Bacteroidota bacterium]
MREEEHRTGENNLSTEEQFRNLVEKVRPYISSVWMVRKQLAYINIGIAFVATAILLLFVKPYYDTSVSILPDYGANSSSILGQISGLASLAGVNVGGTSPIEIYQDLVTSESVLAPVIYAKYKTEEFPDSVNLIEYDGIEPDGDLSPELQKRKMFLKELDKLVKSVIRTDVGKLTQILTVVVRMPEGQLSADVANNIALSLDNYIQKQIRTSARDQRQYIGKRMDEVKDSLTVAENKMGKFKEANKVIMQSPQLMLELGRLQRDVEILNAVYLQLAQQAELAKIQEVKDTPVINIKEFAKNPVLKTGPKRAVILLTIIFFSLLLSAVYVIFSNQIKKYINILKGDNSSYT